MTTETRNARPKPTLPEQQFSDQIKEILADALDAEGMTKADLARVRGCDPAAVSGFLATNGYAPNLVSLARYCCAMNVGLKIELVPQSGAPSRSVTYQPDGSIS